MKHSIERALLRLSAPGAVLARVGGGFGVVPQGDRRRRPLARLSGEDVRALVSEGVLIGGDDQFLLSEAGHARVRRDAAKESERFLAQHVQLATRHVVDRDGDLREARGVAGSNVIKRLGAMKDANGAAWLNSAEIAAAERLLADFEASHAGVTRGSDWSAAPISASRRGASNAQERLMAARCDARRRVGMALDRLAPTLRRVVERVCLSEEGVEAMERAEGWPARSGKVALKLALAQIAVSLAAAR